MTALPEKIRRDRKVELLRAAIADCEAEFGEISGEEVALQQRTDTEDAVVVHGRPSSAADL